MVTLKQLEKFSEDVFGIGLADNKAHELDSLSLTEDQKRILWCADWKELTKSEIDKLPKDLAKELREKGGDYLLNFHAKWLANALQNKNFFCSPSGKQRDVLTLLQNACIIGSRVKDPLLRAAIIDNILYKLRLCDSQRTTQIIVKSLCSFSDAEITKALERIPNQKEEFVKNISENLKECLAELK